MNRPQEIQHKLGLMRAALRRCQARALRLKGSDWFFWASAGADNTVLTVNETGIAEILITAHDAWVLTDEIEAERLKTEQSVPGFQFHVRPWTDEKNLAAFILDQSERGKVLCDRPSNTESPIDLLLQQQRFTLTPPEISRYKKAGLLASQAMTEVLKQARYTWSELELAGAAAECLWSRGLTPALILAAGSRRLALYRHPLPGNERLDKGAMLVFCARGFGLYANLTRFIAFTKPDSIVTQEQQSILEIEAAALNATKPGMGLSEIYAILANEYARIGKPNAINEHHQGGLTGYLAREAIAQPASEFNLEANNAVAWNPSLPGTKIEDTFLLGPDGKLENLTFDNTWPHIEVSGRKRPMVWQT